MDIRIIAALIAVAGTLLGVWLGGILSRESSLKAVIASNKNAIDLMKRQEFNKAVASFRSAFAPALAFIYLTKKHGSTHEVPDVDKFLKDALLQHAAALEVFRIFIPESKRTAYQEAWEKYRYEVWNYGFGANSLRQDIDDPYGIYENLIHDILQFAKEK